VTTMNTERWHRDDNEHRQVTPWRQWTQRGDTVMTMNTERWHRDDNEHGEVTPWWQWTQTGDTVTTMNTERWHRDDNEHREVTPWWQWTQTGDTVTTMNTERWHRDDYEHREVTPWRQCTGRSDTLMMAKQDSQTYIIHSQSLVPDGVHLILYKWGLKRREERGKTYSWLLPHMSKMWGTGKPDAAQCLYSVIADTLVAQCMYSKGMQEFKRANTEKTFLLEQNVKKSFRSFAHFSQKTLKCIKKEKWVMLFAFIWIISKQKTKH